MNLHSGHPFWAMHNGLLQAYPPLESDVSCDAAIIGGGITGALLANALVQAGVSCAIVDRRDVGQGSTCASTALLQYEIDTLLHKLEALSGRRVAQRAYRLGVLAIQELAALCKGIDCGFVYRPSLLLARRESDLAEMRLELQAREAAGLDVSMIGKADLLRRYGLQRPAAIRSSIAAEVDPYRLMHHLLRHRVQSGGLQVFDRTTVLTYETRGRSVTLRTNRGFPIRAKAVFFASGYETKEFFPRRMVRLKSTYATVSEPMADFEWWGERALLWEMGERYLYARTTSDSRILVGGEDDRVLSGVRRDALMGAKAATLRSKFAKLTGRTFESAFTWAGPFGSTKDGLAYIGPHAEFPRAYFALGFGGNGITFSVIAAGILRDLFLGRQNRDAAIFSFAR